MEEMTTYFTVVYKDISMNHEWWAYCSRISDLKEWLNIFGFNVKKVELDDLNMCTIEIENPICASLLMDVISTLDNIELREYSLE